MHGWLWLLFALSSALSVSIFAARVWYTASFTYFFLNWNLFLAWAPFVLASMIAALAQRRPRPRGLLVSLLAAWLLFFPNAPYIISDLMHLSTPRSVPIWYDAILIFSYAWTGLLLGFASLWLVQQVIADRFGVVLSWLFAMSALLAAGFGIYLGRFQRWNSWDLFVNPLELAATIVQGLLTPWAYPRAIVVTLLFASFMAIAYSTVYLFAAALSQQNRRR
jgi:uncharacterized membrane protein